MRRERTWRAIVVAVIVALTLVNTAPAHATQLLANASFSNGVAGWAVTGEHEVVAGAVLFDEEGRLSQVVPIAASGAYTASVSAAGGGGSVTLEVAWWDAGSHEVSLVMRSGPAGQALSVSGVSPVDATQARVVIRVFPAGSAITIEEASLDGPQPPPPASASPTATPTVPKPTATRTPLPAGASPTVSRTPTRTPTAVEPSPSGTTSANDPTATATRTPTPTPGPTEAPAYGGLIANGNFERLDEGRPYAWAKFGGTMGLAVDAYEGAWTLSLGSDGGGTRWVHQAARVAEGAWYSASAVARMSGAGEAFLRLSWYASLDGSGTALSQADGAATSSSGWGWITSGAKQAPAGANSVRVRLMLRAPGEATAYFDNVSLVTTVAPPPGPTAARGGGGSNASSGGVGGAQGIGGLDYAGGRTLAISELMADPTEEGRDTPYEWVELYNFGKEPVSLAGWQAGDARGIDTLTGGEVAAGAYVVIAGESAVFADTIAVLRVPDGAIGSGLNNDGDTFQLLAPDGELVDAMSFGSDVSVFDPAPPAAPAGGTIGARVPGADPDGANWALTLAPSPGEVNSFLALPPATLVAGPGTAGTTEGGVDTVNEYPLIAPAERIDPVALVVLGGAAGAGAVGAAIGLRRAWPSIVGRFLRGG